MVSNNSSLRERVESLCWQHDEGQGFVLRSGKVSSAYFDKLLITGNVALRNEVVSAFAKAVPRGQTDAICGIEIGSIPFASIVAHELGLPTFVARKERKTYGTQKIIEGGNVTGMNVCVVEDTITSGGQLLKTIDDLRTAGATVTDALCLYVRNTPTFGRFKEHNVNLISIL